MAKKSRFHDNSVLSLSLLLSLIIFVIDGYVPVGYNMSVLYLCVVGLTYLSSYVRMPVWSAIWVTALTYLGFLISTPVDGMLQIALVNRSLLVASFWLVAFLAVQVKKNDRQLQIETENHAKLSTIVKSSEDAILSKKLDGTILTWNDGAEKIFGYRAAEIIGKNIRMLIPKPRMHEEETIIENIKNGNQIAPFETQRLRKDGVLIDLAVTVSPVYDRDGVIVGASKIARDITTQKNSEKQLLETKAFLEENTWLKTGHSQLADLISGTKTTKEIANMSLDFICRYINAQVGALYLKDRSQSFAWSAGFACSSQDIQSVKFGLGDGLIGRAAAENQILSLNPVPSGYFKLASAFGEKEPVEILFVPARSDDGVTGVIELGFFHAVSSKQKAFLEQVSEVIGSTLQMAESRVRLQELLEETQSQREELQSQKEKLEKVNATLEEQTEELKSSQERLEVQQADLERFNQELEEQQQNLKTHRDELQKRNEDLVQVRQDLLQKTKDLELASQYKSEFLANMSHELRTPLNSLLILANILLNDHSLTEEQRKAMQTIYNSGNDLHQLINDILDLSKVEAGHMEIQEENVALSQLADWVQQNFNHIAKEKGLDFDITIHPDVPDAICTDKQRLEQILRNLLSNAFKFTEKGSVRFELTPVQPGQWDQQEANQPMLALIVKDTGVGIAAETQNLVFEPFRQADGSISRKYGGTGLGLSIVRELVQLLNGKIELESKPGEGSVFTLYLPNLETQEVSSYFTKNLSENKESLKTNPVFSEEMRHEFSDDRSNLQAGDKSLLVIEDDPSFAKSSSHSDEPTYQCHNANVTETSSGNKVLSTAVQNKPISFFPSQDLEEKLKPGHVPIAPVLEQKKYGQPLALTGQQIFTWGAPVTNPLLLSSFKLIR